MLGARRAACNHNAQAAAEFQLDHVHHRATQTDLKEELRDLRFLKAFFDFLVELFSQKRNGHENRGLKFLHIAADGAERFDELHFNRQHQAEHEVGGEGEGVEKRENNHQGVGRCDVDIECHECAFNVGDKVAVREHSAFGLAGGAGGVDDGCDVVALCAVGIVPCAAAGDAKLFVADYLSVADLLAIEDDAVDDNDRLKARKALADLHHHFKVSSVGGNDGGVGVLEDVFDFVVVKLRIERSYGEASAGLREVGFHPDRRVAENDGDILFAWLEVEHRAVAFGDFAHAFEEVAPGAGFPLFVFVPLQCVRRRIAFSTAFKKTSDCHTISPYEYEYYTKESGRFVDKADIILKSVILLLKQIHRLQLQPTTLPPPPSTHDFDFDFNSRLRLSTSASLRKARLAERTNS